MLTTLPHNVNSIVQADKLLDKLHKNGEITLIMVNNYRDLPIHLQDIPSKNEEWRLIKLRYQIDCLQGFNILRRIVSKDYTPEWLVNTTMSDVHKYRGELIYLDEMDSSVRDFYTAKDSETKNSLLNIITKRINKIHPVLALLESYLFYLNTKAGNNIIKTDING